MFTLEQKIDMVMRYIATADKKTKGDLKKAIIEALNSDEENAPKPVECFEYDDIIYDILKNLGVPPNLIGYKCVYKAIQLGLMDPGYLDAITKWLYPTVAKAFDSTPSRVERAIRHAVETTFSRGDPEYLTNLFGYTVSIKNGKLTNSEFIASCVNHIKHTAKE